MHVLVTGGDGFIRSATVEALRRVGDKVVVLNNQSSGHRASIDPSIHAILQGRRSQYERGGIYTNSNFLFQ